MKSDAEASAESDAKKKAEIEKLNQADAMVFQTEKQLKEFGEKLSDDAKSEIESLKDELKKAHEAKDMEAIDSTLEKLNAAWSKSSEQMYSQANESQTADVNDEDKGFPTDINVKQLMDLIYGDEYGNHRAGKYAGYIESGQLPFIGRVREAERLAVTKASQVYRPRDLSEEEKTLLDEFKFKNFEDGLRDKILNLYPSASLLGVNIKIRIG